MSELYHVIFYKIKFIYILIVSAVVSAMIDAIEKALGEECASGLSFEVCH
jgi:hypothetical protein